MEELRWLWDKDATRPEPNDEYELIRVYAQPNQVENESPEDTLGAKRAKTVEKQPPDYTLYDKPDQEQISINLGLPIGPLLRVCKSQGPKNRLYDSYFLVIDRKKSKEIDWKQTPYIKVTRPWDCPTEPRGLSPLNGPEESFIDTAKKACLEEESKDVLECFIYQVSLYSIYGVDRQAGITRFKKEIQEAWQKAKMEEANHQTQEYTHQGESDSLLKTTSHFRGDAYTFFSQCEQFRTT
ncbi:hypothetical protein XANCAGTX0491_004597 [Xanthoria calcicola]